MRADTVVQKTCCSTAISSGFCSGERAMRGELFESLEPLLCQFSVLVLTYKVLTEWERRIPRISFLATDFAPSKTARASDFLLFIPFHMCRNYFLFFSRGSIDCLFQYKCYSRYYLLLFGSWAVWDLYEPNCLRAWNNLIQSNALCFAASSFGNFPYWTYSSVTYL